MFIRAAVLTGDSRAGIVFWLVHFFVLTTENSVWHTVGTQKLLLNT